MTTTEQDIILMLDQLADFQNQVDLLNLDKQKLLDEVKIPEEIQVIQQEGRSGNKHYLA